MTVIVWFRQDFRLTDNRALHAALETGYPIIPLFIWSPEEESPWKVGAASRWWLHYSLKSLKEEIKALGSRLIIEKGETVSLLISLIKKHQVKAVFWNCRYEPSALKQEKAVALALKKNGCMTQGFSGALLFDLKASKTKEGNPYKVFTPFWKNCLKHPQPPLPLPAPKKLPAVLSSIKSLELEKLELKPKMDWAKGFKEVWTPGENGAEKKLNLFLKTGLKHYESERDFPDKENISHLSPHLHFGEISPCQIWYAVQRKKETGAESYLRQLGWREFAHSLLVYFPFTANQPLRREFEDFPWKKKANLLQMWQKGQTGYPIIDAGMRQLWQTGWMHNRVRMIVGSFLVKDLMIPWQEGAKWFWDTLVDADLANNTFGWQWVAGCGADAAPYFRIFNPILQGERFDPEGKYVRRYVPELQAMPNDWIHKPWLAPEDVRLQAHVILGKQYPKPIVNHDIAKKQALELYRSWIKK